MEEIDWDGISTPAEPLFLQDDISDPETELTEDDGTMSASHYDDWSETQSVSTYVSGSSQGTLRGGLSQQQKQIAFGQPRTCVINKGSHEEWGFFLAIDRDRSGNIIRRIERMGPADRAGLRDGDRIDLEILFVELKGWVRLTALVLET